jgi:hypothetical protein
MTKKIKLLIIIAAATLISFMIFYLSNKHRTTDLFSQTLPFVIDESSTDQLLKINSYLKDHQDDETAYLAAATCVSADDLKKKYLNLALQKKTNSSLAYEVAILTYPTIEKNKRNNLIDLKIKQDPTNTKAHLWKVKLYLDDGNTKKAYLESKKILPENFQNSYHLLYKSLVSLYQHLGFNTIESKLSTLSVIGSLQVKQSFAWSEITRSLEKNSTTADPLEKEKYLSIILTFAKAINKGHTIIDKLLENALQYSYWQNMLKNNNKLTKKIESKFAEIKEKDRCLNILSKSLDITNYMKKLSPTELSNHIDKIIFIGEYKTFLSLKNIQKVLSEENCHLD